MDKLGMALAVEAAGSLADRLRVVTMELDWWREPQYSVDAIESDLSRLEELLRRDDVAKPLSLANPYPVVVGGTAYPSYTAGVAAVGRVVVDDLRSRGNSHQRPVGRSIRVQCEKELERATGQLAVLPVEASESPKAPIVQLSEKTVEPSPVEPPKTQVSEKTPDSGSGRKKADNPRCPRCKGEMVVSSTRERWRHFKCKDIDCGGTDKKMRYSSSSVT